MKKIISFVVLVVVVLVISCSKGGGPANNPPDVPPVDCSQVSAGFAADIFPLVQTRCATGSSCHGSGSSNGPGPLTNFTQAKNAAVGIRIAVTSGRMPLGSSLTNTQVTQIRCWVDNGSLNN